MGALTSVVAGTFLLMGEPVHACSAGVQGTFLPVREIPDVPFSGWDPPDYRVDTNGKVVHAFTKKTDHSVQILSA